MTSQRYRMIFNCKSNTITLKKLVTLQVKEKRNFPVIHYPETAYKRAGKKIII